MNKNNHLLPVNAVNQLIAAKRVLVICGAEQDLRQLQRGHWIGGTIAHCMSTAGAHPIAAGYLFVTDFTDILEDFKIQVYQEDTLNQLLDDRFGGGFTYVLLPAYTAIQEQYGLQMPTYSNLYDVPLMGWVTGVDPKDIGTLAPMIVHGETGKVLDNALCALHIQLPKQQDATLDIVNIYEQGAGDTFNFLEQGFRQEEGLVNGDRQNLAHYFEAKGYDRSLPLVASYAGVPICVDIRAINANKGELSFYAPVQVGHDYQLAKPVANPYAAFCERLPTAINSLVCSCNCYSSYTRIGMEGKHSGGILGPFTFGEIAYVLVNQTLVTLSIETYS